MTDTQTHTPAYLQLRSELNEYVKGGFQSFRGVGNTLIKAKRTPGLLPEEYDDLINDLLAWGWTTAAIECAIKVADGSLPEELFFAGAQVSKILNMERIDQQRLLAGERFKVRLPNGDVEEKTWTDMSSEEKNNLIGRNGQIREPDEQVVGRRKTKPILQLDKATGLMDGVLHMTGQGKRAEIPVGRIKATLPSEQLQELVVALAHGLSAEALAEVKEALA